MNNTSGKADKANQKCLPRPERSPDALEYEFLIQMNKGTPLENPLVCNKCKTVGLVVHVKQPIFWRYFLYLICPKCDFHWRIYYEHTVPTSFAPDCTSQDKHSSFCIEDKCEEHKMGNYNVCRFHFERFHP